MKRIAYLSMLSVAALMLSYIESIIPMPTVAPGIKLGLANIATLFLILYGNKKEALLVLLCRIVLSAVLFTNPVSLIYSLCGGLLAYLVMLLLRGAYPNRLSIFGISVMGALAHNIGQIACACIVFSSATLLSYLPILILTGLIAGIIIALIGKAFFPRLNKIMNG